MKKQLEQQLEQALEQVQQGKVEQTAEVVAQIKALPRTAEGVFDLSGLEDAVEIKRMLYPVYAAYETSCNKKEGYPDLLQQMRVLNAQLQEHYDMLEAAIFMDMSLRTLMYVSPEIYECYRELMDMYKDNVHRFIRTFYGEGGLQPGSVPSSAAEVLFIGSLMLACKEYILLNEKYEVFFWGRELWKSKR